MKTRTNQTYLLIRRLSDGSFMRLSNGEMIDRKTLCDEVRTHPLVKFLDEKSNDVTNLSMNELDSLLRSH
jgi:hypothetical protein